MCHGASEIPAKPWIFNIKFRYQKIGKTINLRFVVRTRFGVYWLYLRTHFVMKWWFKFFRCKHSSRHSSEPKWSPIHYIVNRSSNKVTSKKKCRCVENSKWVLKDPFSCNSSAYPYIRDPKWLQPIEIKLKNHCMINPFLKHVSFHSI